VNKIVGFEGKLKAKIMFSYFYSVFFNYSKYNHITQPKMKKFIYTFFFIFAVTTLSAQDVIYTVSGEYNNSKTPLDSIIVENLSNKTSFSFTDLPEHDFYQINLTKNSYWGTVSVFDIEEAPFFDQYQNSPGMLSIVFNGYGQMNTKISVLNINGQVLYSKNNLLISPHQLLQIKLGNEGMYFVKVESSTFSKSFKAIGLGNKKGYEVNVVDGNNKKSNSETINKSATIFGDGDFTFEEGDRIRVRAYRKDFYASPIALNITNSVTLQFNFDDIIYADNNLEIAFPNSNGIIKTFTLNDDTLHYEEIGGYNIFQGDIRLTDDQINGTNLKGAGHSSFAILWTDSKVYYKINEAFNENDIQKINLAIREWTAMTSLSFIERTNQENYIEFVIHNDAKLFLRWHDWG
jgi:hypothetical protein